MEPKPQVQLQTEKKEEKRSSVIRMSPVLQELSESEIPEMNEKITSPNDRSISISSSNPW